MGEIPYERYGSGHRRVILSDLLAYRDASSRRRKEALEEMRDALDEAGLYDLDAIDAYLSQFDGEGA